MTTVTARLLGSRLSTRSTLRERAASIDDADDTKASLEFQDKDLEQRWSEEGVLLNMKLGCQQLLLLNSFWFFFSSYMLMRGGRRKWAFLIDVIFLIVMSTGVVLCLRRPMVKLYYFIVSTWFIFAFIHGIQPWSHSCEDLIKACALKCHQHQPLLLATFNMDCSLQGQTTVHIVMATLLLSSRLIPALRMMYINWVLILLYLLATVCDSMPLFIGTQRLHFHEQDVWITAAILFFVTLLAGRQKFFMEKGQRSKFFYDQEQQAATKRIFHILEYMVPFHVILPMLKNPGAVIAEQKQQASILFVMVENFDDHARHLGAEKLMEFLNSTFTMMDLICAKHAVTKIETVGEEYVCAVGVVPEDEQEAKDSGHTAVLGRLIQAAAEILAARKPKMGLPVTFKMGMHTGPVVAGVIGQKLPRFRLFGDTVNTAARMMQKGFSGSLQFGQETFKELPEWVQVDYRGKIEMKGKGEVDCWLFKPPDRTEARSVQFDRFNAEDTSPSPSPSRPTSGFRASILRAGSAMMRTFSRSATQTSEDATPHMRRNTVGQNVLMRDGHAAHVLQAQRSDLTQDEKVTAQEEKFQRVLRELHQRSVFKVRSWKWWFSVFLRSPDFTSEIEDKWQRWYHENTICKKLEFRLDRQSLALAILTAVEVFCCTFMDTLYTSGLANEHWRGNDGMGMVRLPLFLVCRGLSWVIIWTWQRLARAQHRLLRHPNEAQKLLAASFGLIAVAYPLVQDGADPWSACHSYVNEKRQEWELECQQCNEQCHNIDWSDPEHEPCNCHEVDGPCDYWRREEGAQRECMDDYCGRYCSGGECASLYRWQCIYAGFSFVSSRKEECLSECSAAGGPNPIPPKNCRAVLNPSTATEDACWKLGQGWIELHYADIPNWDWGRGPPPPESCVIKSYEVLDGKPYVPPPPYGPTCLPEYESELDSCIENPNCHNYLEAEGKPVFQICEERFELFRESFESCLEQKRNGCSGVGCMRIYRACRISTGLEVDHIFKDVGCAGCDGWWSNRASRELQCAEELSVEQCRWNVLTQSTESQACARECVWEVCDQAFSECQIAGGSLSECNDLTIAMNQCRECNFIHCEDGCSKGACDVIFGSRDEAYRSCAGCDTSAQCNPSSPCYGDSADSSCNWRWAPEFGYSCSILCEESLRMCQEGVRGFCWEPDDTGVSRSDACHMEYDMYRADMDACWQANFPATLPEGAIWREIEIETTMTCAAQHLPQNWDCLKCDGEWNSWVVWSADLGPKCIAGTVSFDNGKTVPDTCSNCKPRTCPQYPVNCDARWYDERQCHWNEYNFKICSKSGAEAKATVVAANAECADCQTARCEWSCYDHTCSELMVIMPWDRMAPVEQCGGCPDVARCHPGAECFISDVVAYTQDDLNDWEQFLTLFQPMMDQYVACTGMSLQRRLKEDEAKTPKVQPTKPRKSMATKAERTPQVLKDLENKVTALWRQGNRLRNEGRNKRYQLKQLAEQNVGRTNFQGVIARRNLLEKQHQELQKRYLTLVQNHGEALKKWQNEGGVVTAPPHHPMSSFTEELRTIGSSESRRLQDMPQQVQLACTGSDCATQSGLCDAFFNRGGVAQQLVDTLVSSFSYDLLPWESGDKICQQMAEICYMSLDAAETAIVQGVYDNTFTPPWVDQWCDGWADMANCDASTQCSSCSDLTSAVDYNTCEGCCQCLDDVIGYYARLKHSWSIPEAKCRMLGEYLRKTGKDAWIHYDEKLLGGEGACSMHVDVWQLIPEVCHDPECYQSEECSKQCFRPEATKEMCPSPFTWSFFKSTREWRPGMLATQSTCEVESCYPQPWIPTEAECKTVSHCESDCPYCETDQFWDWEMKKTMVKCSFVNSKTSKPLSEADCKIACGGSFSGTCYFKKDNRSTAAACITDPPTDALGSTTYEKCVGQKALTGASAQTTFGQDMACTIHRLQCKNRADCKEAGRCDYEWDDWQIQENGGLCVAPNDFSKDTSYSPHRDFWGECSTLGGEHRSYGCMLYQVTSKDACTQAGAKWFPSAHSKSKCEVPGYAWKKMSSGGFYSGTMACCIQLRGSKSEGRCEMFTQDENSTSCEHCGGTWMSIFRFRSHGRWVEGSWQKNYKWTARAFEPSNKWVTRIAFEKVTDVWQNLIAAIRAVPAVNFVTCRIGPTLDTLVAIAKQTTAQSTLGTVPLLPATASATQVGDYVIEPSDNSVTGTTEIDVQVNLLSSGAVVAENAKGNSTNTTGGNRRMRRKRRLAGTGLSDTLTASCYTVVVNAGRYIGQLVGDCIIFSPSTALDNPVKVCLPTNPQIPVYGAFNLDCLVTVSSGVYSVAPMTVTKSTDGLSTCAQLSAPGTYCPGKIFGTGEPDRSAPSSCGSVTTISDNVVTQAAVLKAAGPVSLPGLVKIGETVSSDGFAPQAVYISSSGTVQSVEDFAETAQQITGTNAGGASTTVATTTVATTAGSSTTDESAETTEGEGTTSLDGRESSSTIKLSSNSCLPASMAVAAALLQLVM